MSHAPSALITIQPHAPEFRRTKYTKIKKEKKIKEKGWDKTVIMLRRLVISSRIGNICLTKITQ